MDTHVPTDTVREALLFSATLRQPASVPLEEKVAYVETCLKMCGLEAVADASVGSLGIEHRKRTTIGVELAAKSKLLLFLDEPTSGLDSQSSWAILLFLKQLAANGQAILCTHQPSAELFQMFDRLLLLRKGGQVVYFGDIGQDSKTLIHYFESNGARSCDTSENPCAFFHISCEPMMLIPFQELSTLKRSTLMVDVCFRLCYIVDDAGNRPFPPRPAFPRRSPNSSLSRSQELLG
ncbi:P-loop containing nucleoside triphosphate hydrolase protein [Favolaschia claudopus]|uniref:P-loop containing nucleoside triphosphate hydrolase protein n=1 Tax=Favolaschia claudopus TaxID=2862362 RepID=A0AAW0B3S9_9AGAR